MDLKMSILRQNLNLKSPRVLAEKFEFENEYTLFYFEWLNLQKKIVNLQKKIFNLQKIEISIEFAKKKLEFAKKR